MIDRWLSLAGLTRDRFERVLTHLPVEPARGRPWSLPRPTRVLLACVALRTNLTMRELAVLFATSSSTAHRVVVAMTPRLAARAAAVNRDRRWAWVVDGTLIPTRDHRGAAKSKNYRWSCNAQILVRRCDLLVIATAAGGPGNRNDPIHYRGSTVQLWCQRHGRVLADGGYRGVPELVTPQFRRNRIVRDHRWRRHRRRRARVEHAIARLKNWRVLRDHRRRGHHLQTTLQAAFLHNLQVTLRDNP
ncbi:MAG: transposase family protein [Deltaproteobacteria bacterium]|nr:transposase family protein [Deltaproteobacteria bacterium]